MDNYKIIKRGKFDNILQFNNGENYIGMLRTNKIFHVIEKIKDALGLPYFITFSVKYKSIPCTFYVIDKDLYIYDKPDKKFLLFHYLFNMMLYKNNILTDGINTYSIPCKPTTKKLSCKLYDFNKLEYLYKLFPKCDNYLYKLRNNIQNIINNIDKDYIWLENIFYDNVTNLCKN